MPNIGPIHMTVAGDTFTQSCRILEFLWEAASNAGDTVEFVCPKTGVRLWRGRANDVQTYLGANFGFEGVHAPFGFKLNQISSGDTYVYLREN